MQEYFHSLPFGTLDPSNFGGHGGDYLYDFYVRIHTPDMQRTSGRSSNYHYPHFFQPFLNDYIRLYINHLTPYLNHLRDTKPWILHSNHDPRNDFKLILENVGAIVQRKNANGEWEKINKGQIRTMTFILRDLLAEMSSLLGLETENEELRYREIRRTSSRGLLLVNRLGARSRFFGSQRLSDLMDKYMAPSEEEVNWDVVRGIEAATRLREDTEPGRFH
ncbi:hypothetical protein BJ508DRAFT_416809 [Ascobolus immersus RN42]|uniref:Uncharacterized protein n=1 Tax=Ascobolus immersus RN42 TaxID=1160509 RepID=A0A3N4I7V5_ASCIM|nr:hypothetical protein BJ508DRAFT_416809 [Ascobolus immersus RN42]